MDRLIVNAGVNAVAPIIRKYVPAAIVAPLLDNIRAGISGTISQVKDYNQAYAQASHKALREATATVPQQLKRKLEELASPKEPPKKFQAVNRTFHQKRRRLAWKWNYPAKNYYSTRRAIKKTFRSYGPYWRRYYTKKTTPYQAIKKTPYRRNARQKKARKN